MTESHCFSYVTTDMPPGLTIDEYRPNRPNANGRRRWWRVLRLRHCSNVVSV